VGHVYGKMQKNGKQEKAGTERVFESYSVSTRPSPGVSCTKGGKGAGDRSANQDNFSFTYFANGYTMACCMDGHGPFGDLVATRSVQTVPFFLSNFANWQENMADALKEAFLECQRDAVALALRDGWDIQASGSTAVVCVWSANTLWTAHVGDSRLVVGSLARQAVQFQTEDHSAKSSAEKARVEASGGEIRSTTYPDGWTAHRMFVRGTDFPGLCMTRSLGDESVKPYGVTAEPVVSKVQIDLADRPFLILASDGVWEFLDSAYVTSRVAQLIPSNGAQGAAVQISQESRKKWKQEEGDYCDDITILVIELQP